MIWRKVLAKSWGCKKHNWAWVGGEDQTLLQRFQLFNKCFKIASIVLISWSKNFTKNHSNFLWTPPFNHPNFFLFFLHKGAFKYYIRTYWEGYCRPHPTSISDPYWRKTYLNTGPKWRTNQYFGSSPNPKGRGVVSWHCFFVFYSHDCCKGGGGLSPPNYKPCMCMKVQVVSCCGAAEFLSCLSTDWWFWRPS